MVLTVLGVVQGYVHVQVVEVEEFGIREHRQLFIEIERFLLLLLLLDRLFKRRRNRIEILEELREVGRSSPIVSGHLDELTTRRGLFPWVQSILVGISYLIGLTLQVEMLTETLVDDC